ncbi:MAG: M28 family peptidase [Proteobacteria bacterium]|nr:M28 family peptidase [Pseudomonadota bacterium]
MAAEKQHDRRASIESLVRYLCSAECAGRAPGTPGGMAARARIVREFERAGVEPAGTDGYLQAVPDCGANILSRIEGSGDLAERAILVAAHYDHLGTARDGQAFWGADDNAAAVAILIDVAQTLVKRSDDLDRQVILASFDGEEPPHFLDDTMGSIHYVRYPTVPIDQIDTMICMDLVGHALGPPGFPDSVRQTLMVLGAELSLGTGELVERVAVRARGVIPRRLHLDVVPPMSDYYAFRRAGVPVLFLTCGRWQHYHQITDTPEKLDYDKIVATADFLAELVVELSIRPEFLVDIDESGRDDATSVATIRDLATEMAAFVPDIAVALPALEALAEEAAQGPLTAEKRHLLAALLLEFESALA